MTTASDDPTMSIDEANAQSLATGAVGAALLATERALNGTGNWSTAHHAVKQATSSPVDAAAHTGLYHGAPAILFLLHTTTADGHDRYSAARHTLTPHVRRLVRERLNTAEQRRRQHRPTSFAEYDLFYGLTGLGALLLRCQPDSDEFGDLLSYVIRLAEPQLVDGQTLPGWWVDHDPDPTLPTPDGHANLGMAHGAAGLLALLSLAARHGHRVDGHLDAITYLCAWLYHRRQDSPYGLWWPQWITRDQLRTGHPAHGHPGRPSWCYGTPGIARAIQLGAIATNQPILQATAETALAACLNGPQLERLTDTGICHGLAGLYQTAYRAAADARTPDIANTLPQLAALLNNNRPDTDDHGFLTGSAGHALAAETAAAITPPKTRWDTCLLIA